MGKCYWVVLAFFALACGGRSRVEGDSTSGAGQPSSGEGNAGSGGAAAGDSTRCPGGPLDAEPAEGTACPSAGLTCPPFGALSCPLTAVCSPDLKWQISCSSSMLFGSCTCPHPIDDRVPTNHRAAAVPVCSHARAAGPNTPSDACPAGAGMCGGSACTSDAQCVNGTNGRCSIEGPAPVFNCSYDTCFSDSDCAAGSVCQCRDPVDGIDPNHCTDPSDCRVDADCGAKGYCSPSGSHEWCGTVYACHTPSDECLNDSDCPDQTPCDYDAMLKHWRCISACGPAPP